MLHEFLSDVTYRVRALVRRGAMDDDLDAELRFHIEQQAEEFERRGLPRDEALRQARLAFGGLEGTKDATRDARGTSLIESVLQDLRYALRILRKEPGFSLVVVLILGLGIGANVATFSVMNALLLRPLSVPHPEQLVIIGEPDSVGSSWHGSPVANYVSYPVFQDVRDRNHVLTGLYASGQLNSPDVVVREPGGAGAIEHPALRAVSGNFFEVLGVPAFIGRTLAPGDDRIGAGAPVIVVSHGYWQRRLGGDRAAIGRELVVNGVSLTIVGVTPVSFPGDIVGRTVDAWVPLAIEPILQPKSTRLDDRSWSWLQMMGRLSPGVSLTRARSELAAIETDSIRQHATGDDLTEFDHDLKEEPIIVDTGTRGFSHYRRAFGPALTVLMAAVVLVVLIVCANVANLMLVRGVARGREMTIRLTLGASRWRLLRQLLTESLVLAAGGGLLGLFVAQSGSRLLVSIAGTRSTPIPLDVSMDVRVLAFTTAITLLAALLFGLAPATRAARVDIAKTLRAQGRNLVGMRARLGRFAAGKALVIVQIALSAVLLIGAGLLLRSMQRIFTADLGFDRDRLVVVDVAAQRSGYENARRLALMRDLIERVRSVPSVTGVSATMHGLFSGGWGGMHVDVPDFTAASLSELQVGFDAVGPDFFHTIGTRVIRGRDFDAHDTESSARVAIINEAVANAYFRGIDPIGRRIGERGDPPSTIVGVVGDVRDRSVRANPQDSQRRVYFPLVQLKSTPGFVLAAHVRGDPAAAVGPIRDAILARDSNLTFEINPLTDLVKDSVAEDRLTTNVIAFFGIVALVLAAIGLYGLTSYATSQRAGEFGLRIALGAEPRSVTRMIVREATALAVLGLATGLPAGLLATRLIRRQMFGVGPLDPPSLALAVLVLAAMTLGASYLPARRAAHAAPLDALRME